jgi:hypothetical protein
MGKHDVRHGDLRESAQRLVREDEDAHRDTVFFANHVITLIDETNERREEIGRLAHALREISEMPIPTVPSEGWPVVVGRLQLIAQAALRPSHDRAGSK